VALGGILDDIAVTAVAGEFADLSDVSGLVSHISLCGSYKTGEQNAGTNIKGRINRPFFVDCCARSQKTTKAGSAGSYMVDAIAAIVTANALSQPSSPKNLVSSTVNFSLLLTLEFSLSNSACNLFISACTFCNSFSFSSWVSMIAIS
jgi:hypothetical protein